LAKNRILTQESKNDRKYTFLADPNTWFLRQLSRKRWRNSQKIKFL